MVNLLLSSWRFMLTIEKLFYSSGEENKQGLLLYLQCRHVEYESETKMLTEPRRIKKHKQTMQGQDEILCKVTSKPNYFYMFSSLLNTPRRGSDESI